MPEDTENLDLLETPSPAPPQNEPVAPASHPLENSRVEKVGGILDRVAAKFKIGRGRPRKDGSPKVSDVVVTPGGETIPARSDPALAVSTQLAGETTAAQTLFHKCIIGGAKGIIGAAEDYTRSLGIRAGLEPDFVKAALVEARPSTETLADFSEALRLVLEKYQVQTQYAPEVSLAIVALRIGVPYVTTVKLFKAEIHRQRVLAAERKEKK